MRWLKQHGFLLLVYLIFAFALIQYLRGALTYRGVKSWPSVPAEIIEQGGGMASIRTESRMGSGTGSYDNSSVKFRYTVEGKTYVSIKGTADGKVPPSFNLALEKQAFYKPSAPEIAVLSPQPYQGTGYLITAFVTGIMVFAHLWFTLPNWLKK